jgi:hypothetical protein
MYTHATIICLCGHAVGVEMPDVSILRKHVAAMAAEETEIARIQWELAASTGGWLNEGAMRGDLKTYQSAITITSGLPLTYFGESPSLVTKPGRDLLQWTKAIVDLRVLIKDALKTVPTEMAPWCALANFLDLHVSATSGVLKRVCVAEFIEARKETDHRLNVGRILVELGRAIRSTDPDPHARERLLRFVLLEAERANMAPWFSEVAIAQSLLDDVYRANDFARQAISTSNPKLLTAALEQAAKLGLHSDELQRCSILNDCARLFQSAMDHTSLDELAMAIQKANAVGMPETSLTVKARNMYDKLLVIQTQAEAALVMPPRGYGAKHFEKLRWVMQQAESSLLKGMPNYPVIGLVRQEVERCEREMRILKNLREALDCDGWDRAALGDPQGYLRTQSVEWSRLKVHLAECALLETKTEEGRSMIKWASIVVELRRGIKEIGRNPFASVAKWKEIASTLEHNSSRVTTDLVHYRFVLSEHTFFNMFPEFVAIRQEVEYQSRLHSVLVHIQELNADPGLESAREETLVSMEHALEQALGSLQGMTLDPQISQGHDIQAARARLKNIKKARSLLDSVCSFLVLSVTNLFCMWMCLSPLLGYCSIGR